MTMMMMKALRLTALLCFTLLSVECQQPEGCPPEGLYHQAHETACDKYYLCNNGTLTLQDCPNGLLYQEHGAVYEFCAYNWNVPCPEGKTAPAPISTAGCPWQFGIFDEAGADSCAPFYSECVWGIPERRYCEPKGLVYDDRIKGCQWPDQKGCKGEDVIGVKCPEEDKANPFFPYPRYLFNDKAIVVCVNDQPRLVHCPEGQTVDPNSFSCVGDEKHDEEKQGGRHSRK